MLQPKRTKYRKQQKGKNRGIAWKGSDIAFGSFKNQIEYQNAGSGINRAMKKTVLDPLDTSALTGKTVEVTGAFRLINPKNWLITPVRLAVK